MPWHVETDHSDCEGFAVVKDSSGEVVGCHRTETQAKAQLAALNIAENDEDDDYSDDELDDRASPADTPNRALAEAILADIHYRD
jgi:hypothetical protein